jgi:non-ribosomal peptide synthetase component F
VRGRRRRTAGDERRAASDRLSDAPTVVSLDADAERIAARPSDAPESGATPESLAYVIYTSGSTGRPKGSLIPHRAIPGYADAYLELPEGSGPRPGSSTPPSPGTSLTLELWTPLLRGARCVLHVGEDEGAAITPEALGRSIAEGGVTTLWMTSAFFNAVIDTAPEILPR